MCIFEWNNCDTDDTVLKKKTQVTKGIGVYTYSKKRRHDH